jgi:putative transposase
MVVLLDMSKNCLALYELHHLYNRGTEKRKIFLAVKDYRRFLVLLYLCNSEKDVRIGDLIKNRSWQELFTIERGETVIDLCAYCLMPNHFHLIGREKREGGTSAFMQKLMTAYTMYFNARYERTGTLFEGTYKAKHVADDRQLKYLVSYVHLNPVKLIEPGWKETGIVHRDAAEQFLEKYTYSSFLDYSQDAKRPQSPIVAADVLKEYYDEESPSDFGNSVKEWLTFKEI